MKVYVDEMPHSCRECSCDERCHELDYCIYKRPRKCPLKSLADHDKQVRADERKKVRKQLVKILTEENFDEEEWTDILDQIEKGENDE